VFLQSVRAKSSADDGRCAIDAADSPENHYESDDAEDREARGRGMQAQDCQTVMELDAEHHAKPFIWRGQHSAATVDLTPLWRIFGLTRPY
jgi:hypothetical protein